MVCNESRQLSLRGDPGKQPISPQPHPSQAGAGPPAHHQCLMPDLLQHRVSTAGFGLRPAVWMNPTEGCRLLALGCARLGPLSGEARERGAWDTPASRLPHCPNHPRGIPWPRLLQPAEGGCFPPEEGAGQPGTRHGASTASRHGLALLRSALGRHCSSRDRHLSSQGTARDFPGRTKTSGGEEEGEDGVGRGRERRQLHGCRMSRTALHGRRGGFSLRFSGEGAAGSRRHAAARRQCLRSRACPGAPLLTGT